jgi:hypothetical protein
MSCILIGLAVPLLGFIVAYLVAGGGVAIRRALVAIGWWFVHVDGLHFGLWMGRQTKKAVKEYLKLFDRYYSRG